MLQNSELLVEAVRVLVVLKFDLDGHLLLGFLAAALVDHTEGTVPDHLLKYKLGVRDRLEEGLPVSVVEVVVAISFMTSLWVEPGGVLVHAVELVRLVEARGSLGVRTLL